jgi:subtilisin
MFPLLFLAACAAPHVIDAGDPAELDTFDPAGDAFYSDLADAGWPNVPGQYLVLLADDVDREGLLAQRPEVAPVVAFEGIPAFAARMTFSEAQRLALHPDVIAVEPDWLAFAIGRGGATTACATSSAQTIPAGVSAMGTSSNTGSGVKVAVLDTGIDLDHSDLSVAGNVNEIRSRSSGDDDNGHGTHVAGTIAALSNSAGVVGVAPGASLYAVKVLDRGGSGSYSTVAAGIDWAVLYEMDVVNMSLSGTGYSSTLYAAVSRARDADIVQVVAAGNSGHNLDTSPEYPAAWEGLVLTISALDVSTSTWSFPSWSNYGTAVDVAGPGVNVCSTTMGGGYGQMSGTSMASPHVAGAVAVYLQGVSTATFENVESAIETHVTAVDGESPHTEDLSSITGL